MLWTRQHLVQHSLPSTHGPSTPETASDSACQDRPVILWDSRHAKVAAEAPHYPAGRPPGSVLPKWHLHGRRRPRGRPIWRQRPCLRWGKLRLVLAFKGCYAGRHRGLPWFAAGDSCACGACMCVGRLLYHNILDLNFATCPPVLHPGTRRVYPPRLALPP